MAQENNAPILIPFGKYKHQPLEVLIKDEQYKEWLLQQNWFRSSFSNIYNIVVNNFGAPAETPEHNKMVSLFLDDELCVNLLKHTAATPDIISNIVKRVLIAKEKRREVYEKFLFDKDEVKTTNGVFNLRYNECTYSFDSLENIEEELIKIKKEINAIEKEEFVKKCQIRNREFEAHAGSDLLIHFRVDISIEVSNVTIISEDFFLNVECKPVVGEDYPAVIRQCRNQHSNVLVIDNFDTTSIKIEELREMFPDIYIVLLKDIQN